MKTNGGVDVYIHIFLTLALERGGWLVSRPGRFTLGKEPPVPIGQEAGWAPEPVWTLWRRENSISLAGNRTPSSQSPVPILTEISWLNDASCIEIMGRRMVE
jgi:hypothetical protein